MAIGVNSNVTRQDIHSVASTTVLTLPSGTANTDIIIAVFGDDTSTGIGSLNLPSPPSGWTQVIGQVTVTDGTNSIGVIAFWAKGNVANLTFTNNNTGKQQGVVVVGFTGVDNTTPIDATGSNGANTGAASVTAGSVTIATVNAWELIAFASWNGGTNTATGFTVIQNVATPPASNADATLFYNTTPKATGATGTVSCASNASATGQLLTAQPFALRPASTGGIPNKIVEVNQSIPTAVY